MLDQVVHNRFSTLFTQEVTEFVITETIGMPTNFNRDIRIIQHEFQQSVHFFIRLTSDHIAVGIEIQFVQDEGAAFSIGKMRKSSRSTRWAL